MEGRPARLRLAVDERVPLQQRFAYLSNVRTCSARKISQLRRNAVENYKLPSILHSPPTSMLPFSAAMCRAERPW